MCRLKPKACAKCAQSLWSGSVGIKAKPHCATLDCHVATPLLLAMTNGKLT